MFNPQPQLQPQAQPQNTYFAAGSNLTFGPSSNIASNQGQNQGNTQNLSFTQRNPNVGGHEQEMQMILQNFINVISVDHPECLFKLPVYNEIPPNQNPIIFSKQNNYIPNMDAAIWEEKFKTNPDSSKFFVSQIRGMEEMTQRYKQLREKFGKVEEILRGNRERIDKLRNLSGSEISNNIQRLKDKNVILLDKILNIHNMIERISLKHNHYEKNTNEEMNLIKKLSYLERIVGESRAKIFDMNINLIDQINLSNSMKEKRNINKPKFSKLEIQDQKRKTLDLLEKMKNGIDILQNLNQKDTNEFLLLQNWVQNHKF